MEEAIRHIEAGLKGYTIETSFDDPDMIVRIHDGPELVGTLWMSKGDHKETVRSGKRTIEAYAHHILSLGVEEPYRGKGFARRLMIYGMCKMMQLAPSVQWWVLDDDSDATDPAHNIYTSFGFEPVDPEGKGPERQLRKSSFLRTLPSLSRYYGARKKSRKTKSRTSRT